MKIERPEILNTVKLQDLKSGDVFEENGEYWMLTSMPKDDEGYFTVIDLSFGDYALQSSDDEVVLCPEAKLLPNG